MGFIGHSNIKKRVEIAVNSAKSRNCAIPHIMLSGAAGCGKTTTARWLASIGGYNYFPAAPLSLKTRRDVYTLLEKLDHSGYNERGDRVGEIKPTILFFDEIHQMSVVGQELLGIAMERFLLESDTPNKYIWLPYFTVVGATTDDGILTKPFRDRFKLTFVYEPYSDEDMYKIVIHHANKNKLAITPDAVKNITYRSRGVPRTMVNYLETIRDVMLAEKTDIITDGLVNLAFKSMGIDDTGLTNTEIKILIKLYNSKSPIGLDNLAIISNESAKTILQTIEPFLIRRGLIVRMSKGRGITEEGIRYLEEHGHLSTLKESKVQVDTNYRRL